MTLLARRRQSDLPRGGVFATCSARDLSQAQRRGTVVIVPPGTIHPPHARANWVYVVLSGTAIADEPGSGRTLTAGDVHGASAVLAGDQECGALVAQTEVRLLVLGLTDFTALLSGSAGFAHGIARQLAEHPTRSREDR